MATQYIQFAVSGPTVFVILWRTQCSLEYPKGKGPLVLNPVSEVETPHTLVAAHNAVENTKSNTNVN